MRVSSKTESAGKARKYRLYRHIRTYKRIVKIYMVLYTINSDVLIHDNRSSVNLDLVADQLDHNITLYGSESNEFIDVSVYLDKLPDNVKMELNLIQGGTINDQQSILKKNRLELGSGKPVITSIIQKN